MFSDSLDLVGNFSEDKVVYGFDTFALQLQDIDPNLFNGQTFSVNLGSVEDAIESNDGIQDFLKTSEMVITKVLGNTTASIQLPNNFLDSAQECTDTSMLDQPMDQLRLSYFVFLTDILFQSQNQTRLDIGSIVVAARLRCADNASFNFSNPIKVAFRTVKQVTQS